MVDMHYRNAACDFPFVNNSWSLDFMALMSSYLLVAISCLAGIAVAQTCSGKAAAACSPANSNCFNFNSDALTTVACTGFPTTLSTLLDIIQDYFTLIADLHSQTICKQLADDATCLGILVLDSNIGSDVIVCERTCRFMPFRLDNTQLPT